MRDQLNKAKLLLLSGLRADPKKTTLMTALALVFAIAVGRLLITGGRSGAALAALVQSARPAVPSKSIASNKNAAALARWLSQPATPLARNLFATHIDYFPTDNTLAAASSASGDFWSQLGKSITQATDEETKRENLKESFRQQAGKLRLQSTMAGAQPRAILNGKLVSEGSEIESFHVIKIDARRVVLERQGLRFELTMK